MKLQPALLIILVLFACTNEKPPLAPTIIPQPLKMETPPGFFRLNEKTLINYEEGLENEAGLLDDYIAGQTGFKLTVNTTQNQHNSIRLELSEQVESHEGYTLKVEGKRVIITGQTPAGVFYGIQSLMQLIPAKEGETLIIPAVKITDEPRLPYRGMHLDVCRHYFDVTFVKKMLDAMAAHKLNRFHWHLTEDQGWRIEIKKYPERREHLNFWKMSWVKWQNFSRANTSRHRNMPNT